MAPDGRLVSALILLLAACDQASEELAQADAAADGLASEIRSLSARLNEVLAGIS